MDQPTVNMLVQDAFANATYASQQNQIALFLQRLQDSTDYFLSQVNEVSVNINIPTHPHHHHDNDNTDTDADHKDTAIPQEHEQDGSNIIVSNAQSPNDTQDDTTEPSSGSMTFNTIFIGGTALFVAVVCFLIFKTTRDTSSSPRKKKQLEKEEHVVVTYPYIHDMDPVSVLESQLSFEYNSDWEDTVATKEQHADHHHHHHSPTSAEYTSSSTMKMSPLTIESFTQHQPQKYSQEQYQSPMQDEEKCELNEEQHPSSVEASNADDNSLPPKRLTYTSSPQPPPSSSPDHNTVSSQAPSSSVMHNSTMMYSSATKSKQSSERSEYYSQKAREAHKKACPVLNEFRSVHRVSRVKTGNFFRQRQLLIMEEEMKKRQQQHHHSQHLQSENHDRPPIDSITHFHHGHSSTSRRGMMVQRTKSDASGISSVSSMSGWY